MTALACADPLPPDAPGPFQVGHDTFMLADAARGDRVLPVDVWYPVDQGTVGTSTPTVYGLLFDFGIESELAFERPPLSSAGPHPLLVFSHGYQSINTQSVELMEALSSHGFVVIAPEHTGNTQFSDDDEFDEAAEKRVPDVSFLIDAMTEKSLRLKRPRVWSTSSSWRSSNTTFVMTAPIDAFCRRSTPNGRRSPRSRFVIERRR